MWVLVIRRFHVPAAKYMRLLVVARVVGIVTVWAKWIPAVEMRHAVLIF